MTPKYSTSSHHSSMHQYSSEEAENLKKKNSLKEILRAKRQTAVESNYNIAQTNQANNVQKVQTGVYAYHPSQVIMSNSNSTSGLKSYQAQSGYIASSITPQSKYQNYTGPFTQQHHMHQNSLNSYTSPGYYQQVQSPTYSSYSNYQHGLKENKSMY